MHAGRFNQVCGWLNSWFNVLPLDVAVMQLKAGSLPSRAASITFDDGYADNHDVAMPILKHHGLSATFFIATGFLDGGRMWNDTVVESVRCAKGRLLDMGDMGHFPIETPYEKAEAIGALIHQIKYLPTRERNERADDIANMARSKLPINLMMTSSQVKAMRTAGMQIGAHTISHPILMKLGEDEAREEIVGSKTFLENLLDERVSLFAYPNGKLNQDYVDSTANIVRKAGFEAAVSTEAGVSSVVSDLFQLPRFTPWDRSRIRFGVRLLSKTYKAN